MRPLTLTLLRYAAGPCLVSAFVLMTSALASEFSLSRLTVVFSAPVSMQDAAFVQRLSRDVGVTLSYVQPAAENAHIFRIDGLGPEFQIADILQRLRKRADVITADDYSDSSTPIGGGQLVAVKFSRSLSVEPIDPGFVWGLSQDVGVTLQPLSSSVGKKLIFAVRGLNNNVQFAAIAQRLRQRPGVVSVQEGAATAPVIP